MFIFTQAEKYNLNSAQINKNSKSFQKKQTYQKQCNGNGGFNGAPESHTHMHAHAQWGPVVVVLILVVVVVDDV